METICQAIDAGCAQLAILPHPALQYAFMQRAVVALLLLSPLCATLGTQVVNFRLAFFADAVGHSAFTGFGLGFLLTALLPTRDLPIDRLTMIAFGVVVAMLITAYRRGSGLSSDTIIGIFSSAAVALGLCLFSYLDRRRQMPPRASLAQFIQGSPLWTDATDLLVLFIYFVIATTFLAFTYNRLLMVGLNPDLAQTLGIPVRRYEYAFSVLLAVLVMLLVPIVGALLVTAMLVIPAAAARNLARSAGSVFWWGLAIAWTSSLGGLLIADAWETPMGSTIVLCSVAWFLVSQPAAWLRR